MNTVEVWLGNYDGAVDADEGVYTDDGHKWGQTITTGSSSIVNPTFSFKWKRGQGTISGNITVLLYTTSGGVPNTQMASANYPVSNVGTSYAYHDIQFTATLNANTMYAVYVDAVGSSNGNNTLDWGRTNSNVYSGGTYLHKYSSWSITSNADYIVAIRATDVSNKIIQTKTITVGGNLTAYKLLCSKTTSGTATVQYKISFDNGSSWSSAKDLNTNYTDPSTGTSIKLQILLNGTGAANSASASDYALIVSY